MKKSIITGVIILLVLTGFVIANKDNHGVDQEVKGNKIATTIFPIYDITRQIAGDQFEIIPVLPAGVSPHTFDPQPSLLKDLQGSKAIFAIGNGLDDWSNVIAESMSVPIIIMDEHISLRATVEDHDDHDDHEDYEDLHDEHFNHEHEEEAADDYSEEHHDDHENDHDDHSHGPIDPHYWLSVHNAEQITMNIAHELSKLDPENADLYNSRAEDYMHDLESLELSLHLKTESLPNKNIISMHDAWYYFAEEFGLNIVGTFEPSAGKEPTPGYIAHLKEEVEEHNVSTLFMEPQLSQSSIASFTDDYDLSIATIDPLGGVPGRNSYIELMQYNVDQVAIALTK